jgi:hypothetical protein
MSGGSPIASIPPGVDPSSWLQTQRQLQLAQALQGMAFTPAQNDLQQPAGGGKYYQAARVRPTLALSKLAEAMMARKGFDTALPQMAQQYQQGQQAFAPGGQTVPTGQSVITIGPQGDAAGPVPAPRTPTYTQTPQNPMNPQGLPPNVMMRLYQSDPAKYAAMIAGPESVQLGKLAGIDPQTAANASFTKQNSMDIRSGGMVRLPNGQMIRAPNLPPGYEPEFDAQGNLTGTHPSPGLIAGETQREGAVTAAKEANTPRMIPQGGGVESLGYPPTPPALRQPPTNAPPPGGKYFGSGPPTPPMPQAPPSARAPQPPAPGVQPGIWGSVPKLPIPNTPGSTTDTFHQKLLSDAAAKHEELVNKYGSEADLADARIAFNKEALGVLQGAETGPLSDELTKLRAKAQELGVPASWIPGSDSVGDTQLLKKFALRNPLLNLKPTFGGRPAASEFNVLKEEASPSPTMLKPVFARLVQLDNQQAEYTKQRAQDYGTYIEKGGDPMRYESWYANKKPLASYFAQKATPPAALDRLKQHPETLGDFKSAFGWDPTSQ